MYCLIILYVIWFVGGVQSWLSNGEDCTPSAESGSRSGKCIPLKKCQSAIVAIQNELNPGTCGFEGKMPLVCCGTEAPIQASISQQKCRQYSTFVPEYQIFAILEGTQAKPREFPHMAALGYTNGNNGIAWHCGGSLVSDQYVLTAAHCLNHADPTFGPVSHVRLGAINLVSKKDTGFLQDFSVTSRIPHPLYHPPSLYNDIALVRLSRPAQFTKFVKPACLYTASTIPSDMELIATGWGATKEKGSLSNTLQKVDLHMCSEAECKRTYAKLPNLREGIKSEEQFCAGGRGSRKDTCQGDSGGPLQTYNKNERIYYIVGVTSFGKRCGALYPGVYTRVSYYVPWLEGVIWPNN